MNQKLTSILVLGGWSPGPLNHLKYCLRRRCLFLEPSIPMPPVGCLWLLDWTVLAIVIVVALELWGFHRLILFSSRTAFLVPTLIVIVILLILTLRLSVALVVRKSISKAINIAMNHMERNNIAVIVGFSWGGGVVAEMLVRGIVGGADQSAALLIAPTTALISRISMGRDPASIVRVEERLRVHVFHGNYDRFFCPHADRWAHSGVSFHLCEDNHTFLSQYSRHTLKETLINLVETHNHNDNS
mmetsp:Transcript_4161/g.6499  ORF Transcript_4161/g.6499 Transcript_4161/m.6499 type:complete len:244 (-) Transcript_4161:278-1009(-)